MNRRELLKAGLGALVIPLIGTKAWTKTKSIPSLKATKVLRKNQICIDPSQINALLQWYENTPLLKMVSIQPAPKEIALGYYLKIRNKIDKIVESDSIKINEAVTLNQIEPYVWKTIRNHAGIRANWDFATSFGDTIKEKYENLYVKIIELSSIIYSKTLLGGANWILTSPEIASIFETATAGFPCRKYDTPFIVNNKWRLYKHKSLPVDELIMGYQGKSCLSTGFVFMPRYIKHGNLEFGSLLTNPNCFACLKIKNLI